MKEQSIRNSKCIGAKWVRMGLHLHSSGIESFRLPNGTNLNSKEKCEELADEYVKKMEEAQICVSFITDYNGIKKEWFDLIKNRAHEKGIVLFPGIELSLKSTGDPSFYHNRISRVSINGSTFLRNSDPFFNPELNTIIGERGVGKSAIIETMQYAMNLQISAEKSSRIDFVENVVGMGDSELILVLDTRNETCIIKNKVSIDKENTKPGVKSIMEGGETAFKIQAKTYGGI